MFDRYFDCIFSYISSRKKKFLFFAIGFLLINVSGLLFVKLDSNIGLMIPNEEKIRRSIDFFNKSKISDRVLISVGLVSPDKGKGDLIKAADEIASSLDPRYFSDVSTGVTSAQGGEIMDKLYLNLPWAITEKEILKIESDINREYISMKLGKIYRQLLKPGGLFFSPLLRSDPLDLRLTMLKKLKLLSSALEYEMDIDEEHFLSKDGRNTLIFAHSPVSITDTDGSRALSASLTETLAKLPEYISADVISGHLHTSSNEKVIKRDIRITLGIAAVGFLVLILVVFRDVRSILIYLIPLVSVIFSINISYLLLGKLSYSVVGLGAVIAGISIDYGIHMYIAAVMDVNGSDNVRLVAKPVTIGALTTASVFFAFFFSHVSGYYQLAAFSIISIVIALLIAILILPHFVAGRAEKKAVHSSYNRALERINISNGITVAIWAVLTVILLYFALGITFETEMSKLDGTEKSILEAEKRFHEKWGTKRLAILVANGNSYAKALELNEKIYEKGSRAIGNENFASLAVLWPSVETRQKNLNRWTEFWKGGAEQKLRKYLNEEGEKFGFSQIAFKPFFDNLYTESGKGIQVSEDESSLGAGGEFVYKTDAGFQILSFFPDTKEYVNAIGEIIRPYPEAYIVSGKRLNKLISDITISDLRLLSKIAVVFVVLLTLFLLRNVREVALSLLPVATGTIWVMGALSLIGHSLNVATIVPYLVVMGLCVDYGIFITYGSRAKLKTGTVLAVSLSAFSTLIGAGVLLFAKHPVLLSTGMTMVIGVGSGYLSSIFVIPYLYRRMLGEAENA